MGPGQDHLTFARLFLERARGDLKSAQDLLKSKDYADAVYHAQQVAEKAAKALLVLEQKFVRTHLTSGLVAGVLAKFIDLEGKEKLIQTISQLEVHWVKTRYPFVEEAEAWNPLQEYGRKDAHLALKQAKFVLKGVRRVLREKYGWK